MSSVNQLLDSTPLLWKGRQPGYGQRALASGHSKLDAQLPGRGWPLGAMTELICRNPGLGEFRLLFRVLADIGEQGQWVILVDPPWIPYPATLQGHGLLLERLLLVRTRGGRESLWACEQALRNGRGGAVLAWPEQASFTRLRRLQVAAESSAKLAFLFRPEAAGRESSPAALRLQLEPDDRRGTLVRILKCRGNRPSEPIRIPQSFSAYAKQNPQTGCHAPLAENSINTAVAGHPLSTTAAGPP
ncbi:MAG: translesion DNA synthesis-associated protein ImuA [Xanthomonadales bacterium]|nr:translesion DNA synthesis-associated protein ImuA [Gammaproteobacteria bacterium]MBT8052695.1 translesion DNA synthesis-associated protein ImuA [Gammaproteobacteria bacterium]NND56784.1 translesion DNA synthesis-associated protein ImuA [Xanthomonadales bacterium]NNK50647.1 translesion DNA synthesis-associated protein ImuA [Xanthomonadales bacterium]